MGYFEEKVINEPDEPQLDMWLVDQALAMTQGYVLDFNDARFNDFVRRKFGIDATAPIYTVDGTSKAKRLRRLLRSLVPGAQAEVLRAFWAERQRLNNDALYGELEPSVEASFLAMVANLEGGGGTIDLGIIEKFSSDPTLSELVDAIEREIQANAPHAALDRLHTYTMKKFAELLAREGQDVGHGDALHARVSRYVNILRHSGRIGDYSAQIAKSATQIFEQFNHVRNKQSLAHDNQILTMAEGKYVFETVLSLLRFIKSLDEAKFGR